jgi:hypothetical protein
MASGDGLAYLRQVIDPRPASPGLLTHCAPPAPDVMLGVCEPTDFPVTFPPVDVDVTVVSLPGAVASG